MQAGQAGQLGRFGYPGGEWLASEGTPFATISLPPESALKPFFEYVVNDPTKLPSGYRLEQSQAPPGSTNQEGDPNTASSHHQGKMRTSKNLFDLVF
ncbi:MULTISPECIES: glycohydrolase toxin TNT-related protein [unclassified Mycobacteroides]|uniref:glycohydrolase toxin TNT-related protein n=1 Tax=unclassified Mycobacteroides TaxID=2618759 RepID=UPI001321B1B9|nr:hypothetical protein [Mycobacteroides sp. CBMA 326]